MIILKMQKYSLHKIQQQGTVATFFLFLSDVFIIFFSYFFCIRLSVLRLPSLNGLIIFNWQFIALRMN